MKILFAPYAPFYSHLSRCLCLAEKLKQTYQIEFIGCHKSKPIIEKEGYTTYLSHFTDYQLMSSFGAPEAYKSCDLSTNFEFYKMAMDNLRIIQDAKPDLIIFDGHSTINLIANYLNIKCIEIRNHAGILNFSEIFWLKNKGINRTFEFNLNDLHVTLTQIKETIQSIFKLDFNTFSKNFKPSPVFVPGYEEFEIVEGVNVFSNREHIFTGPLHWSGWDVYKSIHEELKFKSDGKHVILVTLGSTFPFKSIINKLLRALDQEQYYFVFNIGDNFKLELEPDIQAFSNYEVHKYIHLETILPKVDVVIHHGGHGTVMQVLQAGIPNLVIPYNGDHMEISKRIEILGLGKRIKKHPDQITTSELSRSIEDLLSDNKVMSNLTAFSNNNNKERCIEKQILSFVHNVFIEVV